MRIGDLPSQYREQTRFRFGRLYVSTAASVNAFVVFLLWFRNRIPYGDEPDPGITSFGRDCAVVLPTGSALCRIPKLWFHCWSSLCTVTAGKMGWLAPPLHHVREWSRAPRSAVTVRHCPPGLVALQWSRPGAEIVHPSDIWAGRVQCLRGRVFPGPKVRPAVGLTIFVPTIASTAGPAPASGVSAMPAVMAWKVSRQLSSVFRKAPFQTKRPAPMAYMRMKVPNPRAALPRVRFQGSVATGSAA